MHGIFDRTAAAVEEGGGWWSCFRADLDRYRAHHAARPAWVVFFMEQGLWALLVYRLGAAIHRSGLPRSVKATALVGVAVLQKWIEIVAGISLPYQARIGPGLYIGHFGNVVLNEFVVIGHTCSLSQGVTIGVSGRDERRGVPCIGNRVYIATNAVVCGRIVVGDDAVIAANSLVSRDVAAHTTVMGVPAREVSRNGSDAYIAL